MPRVISLDEFMKEHSNESFVLIKHGDFKLILAITELWNLTKPKSLRIFKLGWSDPENDAAMQQIWDGLKQQLSLIDAYLDQGSTELKLRRKRLIHVMNAYTDAAAWHIKHHLN